jgi:hypothetical protein
VIVKFVEDTADAMRTATLCPTNFKAETENTSVYLSQKELRST